jgi:hypothetical protein
LFILYSPDIDERHGAEDEKGVPRAVPPPRDEAAVVWSHFLSWYGVVFLDLCFDVDLIAAVELPEQELKNAYGLPRSFLLALNADGTRLLFCFKPSRLLIALLHLESSLLC